MNSFFAPSTYWEEKGITFKMFSMGHIIVIALMLIAIALIFIYAKRIPHKCIKRTLLVLCPLWIILEIIKISLFFTLSNNAYQGLREVLPLYMCSLYIYSLPLAVFFKGSLKKIGEYTLCLLCLISGFLTAINCPVLYSYPFFSFSSLHSVLYHATMAVTGALLVATRYIKIELKRFYYSLVLVAVLAVPAIIMNNVVNTDYMLMNTALGTPILENIAKKIGQIPQIFLMSIIYALLAFLMALFAAWIQSKYKVNTDT